MTDAPTGKTTKNKTTNKTTSKPMSKTTSKTSKTTSKTSKTSKPASDTSGDTADKTRPTAKKKPAATQGGAFATGAARASGERQRRAGTPLISGTDPVEVSQARRAMARSESPTEAPDQASTRSPDQASTQSPGESSQPGTPAAGEAVPHRSRRPSRGAVAARTRPASRTGSAGGATDAPTSTPVDTPAGTAGRGQGRTPGQTGRRLRPVHPDERAGAPGHLEPAPPPETATSWTGALPRPSRLVGAVLESAEFSSHIRTDPAEIVELAVNVLRAAATSAGLPTEDVERQVAMGIAYIRRRLSGSYEVDEFGFDKDFTTSVYLPLLRPLYQKWFRVEVRGVENIPATGGALLVANHSGTVALDSIMTQVAVHDEHPQQRHLRMLGADLVFKTPFVGTIARRSGSTLAANTDAERLLKSGELVGVWPEGFKGVGKPFSERYKLQRFGRGGFVSAAMRSRVPIIPCSIVGAEEIYPIIGNMPTVARLLGVPYVPITPTFPLLGPLGLIPLPSKWLIEFGPPIETAHFGVDAADDPMLVFDLTDQVRETIQQTLYSLLMQRKSVFL